LFVNMQTLPLNIAERFWAGVVLRNFFGFGRMLRVYARKFAGN